MASWDDADRQSLQGEKMRMKSIGNLHESGEAHSGLHVTGGNRNGCSRDAKCSCRQFGRSAKSDSSRLHRVGQSACGDGQEHNREDAGSGFIRPNSQPKTNTAGVSRWNLLRTEYLNTI